MKQMKQTEKGKTEGEVNFLTKKMQIRVPKFNFCIIFALE